MNPFEEELVILKATWDLIDSIVNFDVFMLSDSDTDAQIMFHRSSDQKYFNIVLTDFLSRTDKKAPIRQTSYLGGLRNIALNPSFRSASTTSLDTAVACFCSWLEQEVTIDIWMPSIDQQVALKIARLSFLKMCGDLCKHNFLRASVSRRNFVNCSRSRE